MPTSVSGTLRLDRSRIGVVPGETVTVAVSGATGALSATSTSDAASPRYDAVAHRLYVVGRSPGTATVSLLEPDGAGISLPVLVARAAGSVPSDATLELAGNVTPRFAAARIEAAIAAEAGLAPGATLAVHGVTIAQPLRPGSVLETVARVLIDGHNAFVDRTGATNVHVRVESLPQLEPAFLFYSDDPERLDDRPAAVLYRNTLDTARSARLYVYHVADAPARRLYLALRATGASARVQMLGAAAGPTDAFAYVGHVSSVRYLLERQLQESVIALVPADAPVLVPLGAGAMAAGSLVTAIFDLRLLDGDAVDVSVIGAGGDTDPRTVLGDPEREGDGHGRRGEFALNGVPPLALAYVTGGAEPAPFAIGYATFPNLRSGGRPLGGDYGVLRDVDLRLSNPGADPQTVYLYEMAAGGAATTTMWFNGDERPTEIPCVKLATSRYAVKAFALAPGEVRAVSGEYMTDGASSFPLLFGLTGTAPSPPPGPYSPDACNPKTPPAATPPPPLPLAPEVPVASPAASAAPSPVPRA